MRIAVVGGGISGLSSAYHLRKFIPDAEIVVFESGDWGGPIQTTIENECVLERGPETYQARNPLLHQLARELKIEDRLIQANKASAKRFILKDSQPMKVPKGPGSLLLSPLLFLPQKIKALLALRKPANVWSGMSLHQFLKNAAGETFADVFGSAIARGVYGAEADEIEFNAAFPQLAQKLNKAPTIKEGWKSLKQEREEYWHKVLDDSAWNGFEKGLYSFKECFGELIQAFKERLRDQQVQLQSARITNLHKNKQSYDLFAKKQKFSGFDHVVFTISPHELSRIIRESNKELSNHLTQMQYSPMTVVCAAWRAKTFSYPGFGFLCPKTEKTQIYGTLLSSNIFEGRAPKGTFLTKSMLPGDSSVFGDKEIIDMCYEQHRRLFKIDSGPEWGRVFRIDPGLPKYFLGYTKFREEVDRLLSNFTNVHLTGWHWGGMGVPENLEGGFKLARKIAGFDE